MSETVQTTPQLAMSPLFSVLIKYLSGRQEFTALALFKICHFWHLRISKLSLLASLKSNKLIGHFPYVFFLCQNKGRRKGKEVVLVDHVQQDEATFTFQQSIKPLNPKQTPQCKNTWFTATGKVVAPITTLEETSASEHSILQSSICGRCPICYYIFHHGTAGDFSSRFSAN